jgi:hypothetical protein
MQATIDQDDRLESAPRFPAVRPTLAAISSALLVMIGIVEH